MVDTYLAYLAAVSLAPGKTLMGIWNGHATDVVKMRRISAHANSVSYYEFRQTEFALRRCSAQNGGREIEITPLDSANPAVSTSIKALTTGEWTDSDIIVRRPVSMDEPAVGGAVWPVFGEAIPRMACLWDFGLKSGLRPLTLRQDQGVRLINFGLSDQGEYDVSMEFTVE